MDPAKTRGIESFCGFLPVYKRFWFDYNLHYVILPECGLVPLAGKRLGISKAYEENSCGYGFILQPDHYFAA